MFSKCICLCHCLCLCIFRCHFLLFWSGYVSSSLWSNVSKVTRLSGHSLVSNQGTRSAIELFLTLDSSKYKHLVCSRQSPALWFYVLVSLCPKKSMMWKEEKRNKKGGNIHHLGWKKMWNVYLLPTMRADYCRQLNQCVWLNVVSWPPTGLIYFQALTVIPWFIQCWQTKVNKLSNNHSRNDQQPWQGGRLTVNPWCNSDG